MRKQSHRILPGLLAGLMLACALPISAATVSSVSIPLEQLPEEYTQVMAMENGDVVISPGSFDNRYRLDDFLKAVESGTEASVRICTWGVGVGPFISDVIYDGERIDYTYDQTRNIYAEPANRTYFKSEYNRVLLLPEYSESYENVIMRVYLVNDEENKKRLLCTYETSPVVIETEKTVYDESLSELTLHLTNYTDKELDYDSRFSLYKWDGEEWERILAEIAFPDEEMTIKEGETVEGTADLDGKMLSEDGKYRITKVFYGDGVRYSVYSEFEIGKPIHRFLTGQPEKIEARYRKGGKEISAELTRKGRYEGNSPLIYTADRLAKLNGIGAVEYGSSSAEEIMLVVTHKDMYGAASTDVIKLYSDGKMSFRGNWYSVEKALYSDILGCVQYANELLTR